MGRTIFEKIWDRHLVADLGEGTRLVLIDRVLPHERTGSVALESLEAAARPFASPHQVFATMDHIVDTRPGHTDDTPMPTGRAFMRSAGSS